VIVDRTARPARAAAASSADVAWSRRDRTRDGRAPRGRWNQVPQALIETPVAAYLTGAGIGLAVAVLVLSAIAAIAGL
jgi:hypothetical protein